MKELRQILTEDILEQCTIHEARARYEVYNRLDMTISEDLPFVLGERVFWWFSDSSEFEEPILEDILNVVEEDYLKINKN